MLDGLKVGNLKRMVKSSNISKSFQSTNVKKKSRLPPQFSFCANRFLLQNAEQARLMNGQFTCKNSPVTPPLLNHKPRPRRQKPRPRRTEQVWGWGSMRWCWWGPRWLLALTSICKRTRSRASREKKATILLMMKMMIVGVVVVVVVMMMCVGSWP